MIQNLTLVKSQGKLLPDQNVNLDGDLVIPVYLFCFTLLSSVLWGEVRCVNVSDVVSQCLSGKNWSESSPVRGLITGRVRIMRTITPGSTQTLISCKSSAGTFIFLQTSGQTEGVTQTGGDSVFLWPRCPNYPDHFIITLDCWPSSAGQPSKTFSQHKPTLTTIIIYLDVDRAC